MITEILCFIFADLSSAGVDEEKSRKIFLHEKLIISLFFLVLRKRGKKNQKSLQDLSALSVPMKTEKCAPLPARDFCSYLTKIRRNREARVRFTDFSKSANAL